MKTNGLDDSHAREQVSATNIRLAALEARTRRIEERAEAAREQHHADNLRVIQSIAALDLKITQALGQRDAKMEGLRVKLAAAVAIGFSCGGAAGTGLAKLLEIVGG